MDLANFWLGSFGFHTKEAAVYLFWCLALFAGFPQLSIWFSVFVNNESGFPGFAKEVTPCSRACNS